MEQKAITGYEVARIVNEMLEVRGEKPIPPQMVYNYMKKNYIIKNDQGLVEVDEAERWATKYVEGRVDRTNKRIEREESMK